MESKWSAIVKERFNEGSGNLNLTQQGITDDDIPEILAISQGIQNLTTLQLHRNHIGAEGAKKLAAANFLNLRELGLFDNNLGPEGVKHIANGNFQNLITLNLGGNKIGVEGAKYLASGNFKNLIELSLWDSEIREENHQLVRQFFKQMNITRLVL